MSEGNKTRDQKIDALVANLENWDEETLLSWAQDKMRENLTNMPDYLLDIEYENQKPE